MIEPDKPPNPRDKDALLQKDWKWYLNAFACFPHEHEQTNDLHLKEKNCKSWEQELKSNFIGENPIVETNKSSKSR